MKTFLLDIAICLLQVCLSALLIVLFIFVVVSVARYSTSPWDDWHGMFASMIGVAASLYLAIRIGLHYGSLKHRLPSCWWGKLVYIVLGIAGLWLLVAFGGFDLPVRALAPFSDYWVPSDFSGEVITAWLALFAKFVAAYVALVVIGQGMLTSMRCSRLGGHDNYSTQHP